MNLKQLLLKPRILILLFFLLCSVWIIQPGNPEGVSITAITKNSSAAAAGMESPTLGTQPRSKELITNVNGVAITDLESYYAEIGDLQVNQTISLRTTKQTYTLRVRPLTVEVDLNQTQTIQVTEEKNGTNVTTTKTVRKTETRTLGIEDLGVRVTEAAKNNIRKGLDLQGGTRVLMAPAEEVTEDIMLAIIDNLQERLNVYGLADVTISPVTSGIPLPGVEQDTLILIEMAGVTDEEVKELLGKQGKFEARVSNTTVFKGGDDITYVCRTAQCSGIDPNSPCGQVDGGFSCGFSFQTSLSAAAAKGFAAATRDLDEIVRDGGGRYLSEPIILYLDDAEVDRLEIGAGLRGRPTTDISISGSGQGITMQAAVDNTLQNMKRLQTILITGSLPAKMNIERIDTISPLLGKEFAKNAIMVALVSLLAVIVVLVVVYRKLVIAVPVIITALSEILITLGIASLIGWNIDLAAVAGIIAVIGTGVDDQIVITDEVLRGKDSYSTSWKQRLKNAFFIIFVAYFATLVAMVPLWYAGAGMLKGFAVTTILGVSAGVLITRPAFGVFMEALTKDEEAE